MGQPSNIELATQIKAVQQQVDNPQESCYREPNNLLQDFKQNFD